MRHQDRELVHVDEERTKESKGRNQSEEEDEVEDRLDRVSDLQNQETRRIEESKAETGRVTF